MTSVSKIIYIDKLDDTVNKYNNTYHSTIIIKPIDVNSGTYIDFNKENNKEDPKFAVAYHVRESKYKNISQKVTLQTDLKKFLRLKRLKTLRRGHMLSVILTVKKLLERFRKKNCKKQIKKSLELEK